LSYAVRLARRAQDNGLKPYVVLFLSEDWADYVKQPVPGPWGKLSFEEKLKAVKAYGEKAAKAFEDQGVKVDLFEIGNEIDFGICGEFEEEWAKRVSIPYMKTAIWPKMARIIAAAQSGVKKVRPEARFTLHLAQWNTPEYCLEFGRA
jgi:arabinogalactan endo-1,4-beta-galactosidase